MGAEGFEVRKTAAAELLDRPVCPRRSLTAATPTVPFAATGSGTRGVVPPCCRMAMTHLDRFDRNEGHVVPSTRVNATSYRPESHYQMNQGLGRGRSLRSRRRDQHRLDRGASMELILEVIALPRIAFSPRLWELLQAPAGASQVVALPAWERNSSCGLSSATPRSQPQPAVGMNLLEIGQRLMTCCLHRRRSHR